VSKFEREVLKIGRRISRSRSRVAFKERQINEQRIIMYARTATVLIVVAVVVYLLNYQRSNEWQKNLQPNESPAEQVVWAVHTSLE